MKSKRRKLITVNLPPLFVQALDELVHKKGLYKSRNDAIINAIQDLLSKEYWPASEALEEGEELRISEVGMIQRRRR